MASALPLLLFITAAVHGTSTHQGRHHVVRLHHDATTKSRLEAVLDQHDLDIWASAPGHVDVMLPHRSRTLDELSSAASKATIMIQDVEKLVEEHKASLTAPKSPKIDSSTYRDFETLMGELDQLEADFPSLVTSYEIGTSYEGRPLRVEVVSSGQVADAPVVWLDCGVHAREWVSQATCMYVLDRLTSGYGVDTAVTTLLDTYDVYVLPVTNPDGYVYTWTDERLWRKNRVPYGTCYGVDCNRNWDSNFGGEGSSDLVCADTYHGPAAFSEVESDALRAALTSLGGRVKSVFSLHSYSQYWMFPYGYTDTLPADYDEMNRVAAIGVEALQAVYGTNYVYGNIADVIYVASGGSVDYTYDNLGIVYSYAVELRDQGTFGFLLPAGQIIPTAEEFLQGFLAAIQSFQ